MLTNTNQEMTLHSFRRKQLIALTVLMFTLVVTCQFASATTYNVIPVTLPDGYAIAGGTITTNGTMGILSLSDITGYEVQVTGIVPYTFKPSNPASAILLGGSLIASSLDLTLQIDSDPGPLGGNALSIQSLDNTSPACANCFQRVRWENFLLGPGEASTRRYEFKDDDDNVPLIDSRLVIIPQVILVVATVPEPTCFMLSLLGMCLVGLAARKKSYALRQRISANHS